MEFVFEEILRITDYVNSSTAFKLSGLMWIMLRGLLSGYFRNLNLFSKLILLSPFLFWLLLGTVVMLMCFAAGFFVYPIFLLNRIGNAFLHWAYKMSNPNYDDWGFWRILLLPLLVWTVAIIALMFLILPGVLFTNLQSNI